MSKQLILRLGFTCLAVVAFGAVVSSFSEVARRGYRDAVEIPRDDLELGDVWATQRLARSVRFVNHSDSDLIVRSIEATCNCLEIQRRRFVLPRRQSVPLDLVLNAASGAKQGVSASRPIVVDLVATIEYPTGVIENRSWSIKGTVRAPFTLTPPQLDFVTDMARLDSDPTAQTVNVRSAVELRQFSAESDQPEFFSATGKLLSSSECLVTVRRNGHPVVGSRDSTVQLVAVTADGSHEIRVGLSVRSTTLSRIDVIPKVISLGICKLGSRQSVDLRLHDRTNNGLGTMKHYCDHKSIALIDQPSSPLSGDRVVRSVILITEKGPWTATITFVDVDGTLNEVPVTYIGVSQ